MTFQLLLLYLLLCIVNIDKLMNPGEKIARFYTATIFSHLTYNLIDLQACLPIQDQNLSNKP